MNKFPTLRFGVLQSLRDLKRSYADDDALFGLDECPYDNETIEVLKEILEIRVETVEVEKIVEIAAPKQKNGGVTDEDIGVVEDELRLCLEELRGLNKEREGLAKMDDETLLKIIRAKAGLIEQIVKLRERTMNVRRQSEFEGVIMGILEELVGENDRTEFLKRLEPYRD